MAIIFSVLVLILCFYLLAVLTEEFFVPSIDVIAKKLNLSNDAAGATLLAMGSSAPEFFIVLIAVLGLAGGGHTDIGVGSIVGSAIFNILVIVGISALYKPINLNWKNGLRDLVFYFLTVGILFLSLIDGHITKIEAGVFLSIFVMYVYFVVNWKKWVEPEKFDPTDLFPGPAKNFFHRVTHSVMGLFIPDPALKIKYYWATFTLSILSIAGISFVLVDQIASAATILSINPTFLALTVLAAGTSIPDMIGSIVVAKQGRGDMAFSNAVGSNVFDILFGLGLPWMIALIINPGVVAVGTDNLNASVSLLMGTVVGLFLLLALNKWRVGKISAVLLLATYIGYVVYIALSVT